MARRERGVGAVSRFALIMLVLAGCGVQVATTNPWEPAADITGPLAPSIGNASYAAAAPGDTIRVVTYNVQDGGAPPEVIAQAFLADPDLAKADVVLLQEEEAYASEGEPRAAKLAQLLGMAWYYAPARPNTSGVGTFGDAILSRFPMSNLQRMALPHADNKLQRTAISADLDVGGVPLHVITLHLDTTLNITKRVLQLHPAVIDEPPRTLVGGDFNTNPYLWESGEVPVVPSSVVIDTDQAAELDDYMAGIGYANDTATLGPTEVKYGISSRLDAIYARDSELGAGGVVRTIGLSDHWPVWIDVKNPR